MWNTWRAKNLSIIPDLKGIALALSEDSLKGECVDLKEAMLQNSVLRFATLSTANLEAADMSGADLMHARLDQANLNAVNLSKARLDHAHLAAAILTKGNLCGARLRFANLSTADLQAADMSDADLTHARLNQANLSAANFTNARLDHADFADASLAKVNLCGASLQHAKNLTKSQIEETTGNAATILPPHLQGSVSWSPAISPIIERHDLGPLPKGTANVDGPHINAYSVQHWGVAIFLISVALAITVFIWRHTNEAPPLDAFAEKKGSEKFLTKTSSSLDAGDQGLQTTAPEAQTKEKTTSEQRIITDPTLGESAVGQTASAEQQLALETDEATASRETSAYIELRAPALELAETPPTALPHALIPDLPPESSEPSTLVYPGQAAFSFGAEIPPTTPARNPARGHGIETAQTVWPSPAESPAKPLRNPLR